jgi:hypothetical protein
MDKKMILQRMTFEFTSAKKQIEELRKEKQILAQEIAQLGEEVKRLRCPCAVSIFKKDSILKSTIKEALDICYDDLQKFKQGNRGVKHFSKKEKQLI